MAATDQTYRNQKTLDIVFAVSCILMLLGTLWMFWQDYDRQFKHIQRQFRDVEEALSEYQMLAALPSQEQVAEARNKVTAAKKEYEAAHNKLLSRERELMAKHDLADFAYRSLKADFDSKTSLYNIAVEHLGKAEEPKRQKELQEEAEKLYKEMSELQDRLIKAQDELDQIKQQINKEVTQPLEGPQQQLNRAEEELKKLTANFDRYAKATVQKRWKWDDIFRSLPILDAFESPTKIKQQWLPELTIDYGGFKDVPRYDRCISCHLGIDRGNFDHASVRRLTLSPEKAQKELEKAEARKKELEGKEGSEEEVKRMDARI